jgi:phage tail sheath protein FI
VCAASGARRGTPGALSGWKYVNVRRLFVFIEQFIEEGAHWAVFERNRPSAPTTSALRHDAVRVGDPGYGTHLDGDGTACE